MAVQASKVQWVEKLWALPTTASDRHRPFPHRLSTHVIVAESPNRPTAGRNQWGNHWYKLSATSCSDRREPLCHSVVLTRPAPAGHDLLVWLAVVTQSDTRGARY